MDRILIVEDESIIALNMQHTLQRLGYEVVGMAGSGTEALGLVDSEHPDLVLMDINLGPGEDGIQTAARFAAPHRAAVIYLTAYSEEATLKRARQTGPYGYLVKPFSERELHATIQMAIERRRHDAAHADVEERLRLALESVGMGSWELDLDSHLLQREALTDRLFGIDAGVFDDRWESLLAQIVPEDRQAVDTAHAEAVLASGTMSIDCRAISDRDGTSRWLRLQAAHQPAGAHAARLVGVAQDITAVRSAEASLRQAASAYGSSGEAIFIVDDELRLLAVNDAFAAITGHSCEGAVGRVLDEWLFPALATFGTLDLVSELSLRGFWQGELIALREDGEAFPVWMNATRTPAGSAQDGASGRTAGVFSDIGALRRADKRLIHLAHHDSLTGLPNRSLAMDRLDQALTRARRNRWPIAVFMIDLDHFKSINDTLGHAAGDEMLCGVASRLKASLRDVDTVARLGGDEFLVIVENVEFDADIASVATKLLRHLAEPLMLGGCEVRACASLGVGLFPNHAEDRDSLVRAADAAMYVAKKGGRNRLAFSDSTSLPLGDFVATR